MEYMCLADSTLASVIVLASFTGSCKGSRDHKCRLHDTVGDATRNVSLERGGLSSAKSAEGAEGAEGPGERRTSEPF